jgi:hypothetical protein
MGGHLHTWGLERPWLLAALLATGLTSACSFDSTVKLAAQDPDPTLPEADAAVASPDAARQLTPDAGAVPDANTSAAMGTLRSNPLDGVLELDGELDAQWQALEFRNFEIGDAQQLEAVGNYVADASVRFASLYDDDKLYFFFEVADDLLVNDSENIYNDDSIEIYIDGLNDSSGPYADDDHWILVGANADYRSLGPTNIEILGSINTTAIGYNIEISIDRSAIGAGTAGELGFNIGLNDDDGAGNTGVDAYGLWFLPDTNSCTSCCNNSADNYAWCDTTRLGRLQFTP